MKNHLSHYFECVKDPRVIGRCDHLLSDLLVIAICTYLTGGSDYQDMYLFGKERGAQLKGSLLELPSGHASADTYERLFNSLDAESLKSISVSQTVLPVVAVCPAFVAICLHIALKGSIKMLKLPPCIFPHFLAFQKFFPYFAKKLYQCF